MTTEKEWQEVEDSAPATVVRICKKITRYWLLITAFLIPVFGIYQCSVKYPNWNKNYPLTNTFAFETRESHIFDKCELRGTSPKVYQDVMTAIADAEHENIEGVVWKGPTGCKTLLTITRFHFQFITLWEEDPAFPE